MGFSYGMGSNPMVDYPRMLVGDTQSLNHIFEDEEILSFHRIAASPFQSSMLYSGSGGATLPTAPVAYLRVAAMMLKALASTKARIMVDKLLDANLTPAQTAKALNAQADAWLEMDDNSGAFVIIEQAVNGWAFLDRFYKQVQRQTAQ